MGSGDSRLPLRRRRTTERQNASRKAPCKAATSPVVTVRGVACSITCPSSKSSKKLPLPISSPCPLPCGSGKPGISPSSDWGEEGDFARTVYRGVMAGMRVVDGGAYDLVTLEGCGVAFAATFQPMNGIANRRDGVGKRHPLFSGSDRSRTHAKYFSCHFHVPAMHEKDSLRQYIGPKPADAQRRPMPASRAARFPGRNSEARARPQ